MTHHTIKALTMAAALAVLAVLFETPVSTHHSFAMYDQTKTVTLTGVVKQFVAQANHAELHFVLIAPDRKGLAKSAGRKVRRMGRRDGGCRGGGAAGDHDGHVRGRHGVQRQAESAARRLELRFPHRRASPNARWIPPPTSPSCRRRRSTAIPSRATR